MKQTIILLLLACQTLSGWAQTTMSELFKTMPDSLMPYLSKNNRLDMIDFMEAGMKAEVTNLLDGKSTMTALTRDSLAIDMSKSLSVQMWLTERDSTVIAFCRCYKTSESQQQRIVSYFSVAWLPLNIKPEISSSLLRRDEEVFSRPHF